MKSLNNPPADLKSEFVFVKAYFKILQIIHINIGSYIYVYLWKLRKYEHLRIWSILGNDGKCGTEIRRRIKKQNIPSNHELINEETGSFQEIQRKVFKCCVIWQGTLDNFLTDEQRL